MSVQEERLAQIAAAIREKDGTTEPIAALDFAERIRAIPTGTETDGLPDGYQRLQFIQTSSEQYINTWFYPTEKTRVVMDLELHSFASLMYLFGVRPSTATDALEQFTVAYPSGGILRYYYSGKYKNVYMPQQPPYAPGRFTVDANRNIISAGGDYVELDESSSSWKSSYPLFLLAINTAGSPSRYLNCDLYSCKIYDEDFLTMDFVPCKNPSGVVGLYDVVTRNFFGSFGASEFLDGPSA